MDKKINLDLRESPKEWNNGLIPDKNSDIHIRTNSNPIDSAIKMDMSSIVTLAWGAKEILRGPYKKSQYGEIILPFVLFRRLERVLEPTGDAVFQEYNELSKKGMEDNVIEARLNQITKQYFHNKSRYNLELLLADPNNIYKNIKEYLRGFSENIRDIFDSFKFDNTIDELHENKLLYQIVQQFAKASLDPELIDNHMMGTMRNLLEGQVKPPMKRQVSTLHHVK